MEEEIARVSQDLRQKEDTMANIQSSLAELTHRMDTMETDSHKLGTVCMYIVQACTLVYPLPTTLRIHSRHCACGCG